MFDSCGSASGAKQLAFIYDEVACQLHLRLEKKVQILCETGSCLTEDFWGMSEDFSSTFRSLPAQIRDYEVCRLRK